MEAANVSSSPSRGWVFPVILAAAALVGCSGTSATTAYVGAVETEDITTVIPGGNEPPVFSVRGEFLPGSDWPACNSDLILAPVSPCCFAPETQTAPGLGVGNLVFAAFVSDATGAESVLPLSVAFSADAGTYGSEIQIGAYPWRVTDLSASGDLVPGFSVTVPLASLPAEPIPRQDLSQLATLSTSQDWSVPLTPSDAGIPLQDRVILQVDGVGSVICQVADEGGAIAPSLVVPAALLSNFAGHDGTVAFYRDAYGEFADRDILLVGFRSGVGLRTLPGAVSFTP